VHHRDVTTAAERTGDAGATLPPTTVGAPASTTARPGRGGRLASMRSGVRPFPFHPLLLAAYPVLFLFAQNLTEVALGETYQPILRAAAVAVAIMLVAGLLLRDLRRGALIASAVVIVWFAYGYLRDLTLSFGATRDVLLGACLLFVVAVALLAWRLRPSRIAAITTAANVIAVVLVALTFVDILPYQLSRGTVAATSPVAQSRPAPAPGSRDIYFLIFDRYGNNEAMEDSAGVENDLPAWLDGRGFTVAPYARANYGRTALSLAATLNMTYLDQLAARMGPDSNDDSPLNDMLQDHKVGRFLQQQGYRYVQIGNWWAPTKTSAIADENPQLEAQSDFGSLLDDTTMGPTIDSLMGVKTPPSHHLLHRAAALFDFHELDQVSAEPGPKFVFAHILLPHEPYVFKANGEYSGLSEADSKFSPAGEAAQMAYTNDRIRGLVSSLLDVPPDQQPIILIEADEGPYPDRYSRDQEGFDWNTATDAELATKYGVLTAMYLPGDAPADAPAPYPDMSVINTFPIVFDRYFGQHIPLFPDRSFTSRSWSRPYDLSDITDRLHAIEP
jgi:hypothetical protein